MTELNHFIADMAITYQITQTDVNHLKKLINDELARFSGHLDDDDDDFDDVYDIDDDDDPDPDDPDPDDYDSAYYDEGGYSYDAKENNLKVKVAA